MPTTSPSFAGPSARAWHAYYCLPRNEKGEPPSIRSLEDAHKLSHGTLNKVFEARSKLERTNYERLERISAALQTTPDWLLWGRGEAPATAWHVPTWPGPKKKTKSGTMPAAAVPNRRK